MEKEKIGWVTSLRAIACIAIVLLHVVGGWVGQDFGQLAGIRLFLDGIAVQVMVRWAVPCFVMLSGFLLLNPDKQMPIEKIWKYTSRIFAVLLTFGLVYCFLENIMSIDMSIPQLVFSSIKNLVEGKSWSHMWYVYMIAGMYLVTPVLRAFVRQSDDRTAKCVLLVLMVCTIVVPTVNKFFGIEIVTLIPISSCYVFYYLAGWYISKWQIQYKKKLLVLLGGGGMALLGC